MNLFLLKKLQLFGFIYIKLHSYLCLFLLFIYPLSNFTKYSDFYIEFYPIQPKLLLVLEID